MILQSVAALAALGVSARWNWWRPRAGGLPILMYHKIGDPPAGSRLGKLWVSTDMFRRQMAYLKKNGYRPMTFFDLAALVDKVQPVPENAVVITFDDGYRNNHEAAFPILKEFGFKAVIYLVVNALDKGDNFWHDPASEVRIPMLTWDQVKEMRDYGIEFGSHTMNHPRLANLTPERVQEELVESRKVLTEKLGYAPIAFANPYGNAADEPLVRNAVRDAGYRWAVSVHLGKADLHKEPYCLRRLFVRGDDFMYDFHLNMTRGKARF